MTQDCLLVALPEVGIMSSSFLKGHLSAASQNPPHSLLLILLRSLSSQNHFFWQWFQWDSGSQNLERLLGWTTTSTIAGLATESHPLPPFIIYLILSSLSAGTCGLNVLLGNMAQRPEGRDPLPSPAVPTHQHPPGYLVLPLSQESQVTFFFN